MSAASSSLRVAPARTARLAGVRGVRGRRAGSGTARGGKTRVRNFWNDDGELADAGPGDAGPGDAGPGDAGTAGTGRWTGRLAASGTDALRAPAWSGSTRTGSTRNGGGVGAGAAGTCDVPQNGQKATGACRISPQCRQGVASGI